MISTKDTEEPVASVFMVDKLGDSVFKKPLLSLSRVEEISSRPPGTCMLKVEEMSVCDLKGPAASIFAVEEVGTTISDIWCFLLQRRRDVYVYFRNPTASVFRV
jgi:hypothetical protein